MFPFYQPRVTVPCGFPVWVPGEEARRAEPQDEPAALDAEAVRVALADEAERRVGLQAELREPDAVELPAEFRDVLQVSDAAELPAELPDVVRDVEERRASLPDELAEGALVLVAAVLPAVELQRRGWVPGSRVRPDVIVERDAARAVPRPDSAARQEALGDEEPVLCT